ncbi:hypothetical protein VII00023_01115 [Vibrio ichthyoenteri ATCC 700023]|uniref:Uncharacterized protein n=1 Tax=Vibrio ichthyoenteri ATCC 700023 TaxID=870968 RepID=F9S4L9_9VIBR|nr:hypothetical protein VII00023_01115 [Vibrio ichthyoenteri ATCC 700023]
MLIEFGQLQFLTTTVNHPGGGKRIQNGVGVVI